ncbi:MAG: NAD(+)/NADH kinase [Ruminococcus sp.]|nr:NAD(+)/NADH kinase [Ruminococcus sp.]
MTVFIYPNLNKPNSLLCTEQACGVLLSEECRVFMDKKFEEVFGSSKGIIYRTTEECVSDCNVIVVTGGDGTILRCAGLASKYGKPILGINCGTLGFMASLEISEIFKLRLLCRGEYTVSERMMLSVTVRHSDGTVSTADALNDAVLIKGEECKLADFEVMKSGSVVSALRADGVIFSTATGATAYSLSAGGPIIEPDLQCIEFSQVCAHTLFSRTIVFSPESLLTVKCHCAEGTHVTLNVDGVLLAKLTAHDTVEIKRSALKTRIIDLTGGSFFQTVNSKLMTPLKPQDRSDKERYGK